MPNILDFNHLCFECSACVNICNQSAIVFKEDDEGFSYPVVDKERCTNCGTCLRVCPALHSSDVMMSNIHVFAAQILDTMILQQSSSGGIFSLIAKAIISKGGIVYGAAWNERWQLRHVGVSSEVDLQILRGSKYVHSNLDKVFVDIKNHLIDEKWVYFVGTPCQVAGLRLFLHRDFEKLITSDLICHGTPSQKLFSLVINHIKKEKNSDIVSYSFRDKSIFGWSCSSSFYSNKKISREVKYHYYDKNSVAYFQAFKTGSIMREDCYSCPFSCQNRVGDITIADYWGIEKFHKFRFPRKGISLVLLNSKKGEQLFRSLLNKCDYQESSMDYVLSSGNDNLRHPTHRASERDISYKMAFSDYDKFKDYYASKDKSELYFKLKYVKARILFYLRNLFE